MTSPFSMPTWKLLARDGLLGEVVFDVLGMVGPSPAPVYDEDIPVVSAEVYGCLKPSGACAHYDAVVEMRCFFRHFKIISELTPLRGRHTYLPLPFAFIMKRRKSVLSKMGVEAQPGRISGSAHGVPARTIGLNNAV